jgi:hypothetical protein
VRIVIALGAVVAVAAVVTLQTDAPVLWAIVAAGAVGFTALMTFAARDRLGVPDDGPSVTVESVAALPPARRAPLPSRRAGALPAAPGGALARYPGGALVAPPTAALPGAPGSPGAPVLGVFLHVAVPPQGTAPRRPQVPARVIGAVHVVPGEIVQGTGQGTKQ